MLSAEVKLLEAVRLIKINRHRKSIKTEENAEDIESIIEANKSHIVDSLKEVIAEIELE